MAKDVKLTPLDPPGSSNWKVSHGWSSGSKPDDYPHVKLSQNSGAHVITFDIDGANAVTFNPADPLWVQAGSKPMAKPLPGADQGQIGAFKVLNNGKQLVIVDWNTDQGDLYYHLNFVGHGPLDPIIENGGGIKPPRSQTFEAYGAFIAVALVSLIVGALLYRAFFGASRAASNSQSPR